MSETSGFETELARQVSFAIAAKDLGVQALAIEKTCLGYYDAKVAAERLRPFGLHPWDMDSLVTPCLANILIEDGIQDDSHA